jgi:alkanesulfonate monooxygenase SsuD/methylene tetrahydromethanopterin reductase-like flavin-dependent oxidoreductase (luciferase family)
MLADDGRVHWGVMQAQGWKGELQKETAVTTMLQWATACEDLGFDGIWLFDHFVSYPDRVASPVLEAWTTLGALTRHTTRVALGTLVSCSAYRYPRVTARMAATMADLSNGRFCLGLGAGWDSDEFNLMAIPFPSPTARSDLLLETAAASRLSSPRLPLLIGGEGTRRTLRTAAQYADLTNWQVGVKTFQAKSATLGKWCSLVGRNYEDIQRTHAANVKIFPSTRQFRHWKQNLPNGMSQADMDIYIRNRGAFYGTEDSIRNMISEYLEAGCRGFMLFCNDAPDQHILQQLAMLRPPVS